MKHQIDEQTRKTLHLLNEELDKRLEEELIGLIEANFKLRMGKFLRFTPLSQVVFEGEDVSDITQGDERRQRNKSNPDGTNSEYQKFSKRVGEEDGALLSYVHKKVQSAQYVESSLQKMPLEKIDHRSVAFKEKSKIDLRRMKLAQDIVARAEHDQRTVELYLQKKRISAYIAGRFLEDYPIILTLYVKAQKAWEAALRQERRRSE